MSIEVWLAFVLVAAVATALPGPAMLLLASHSISFGVAKTVFTITGNITGLAILSTLSVAGLGSLLVHSPMAFTFVKIIGACYLIYLGVGLWRKGLSPLSETTESTSGIYAPFCAQSIIDNAPLTITYRG